MQILILGATGRTGKLLLLQALQRGYTVTVLVRDKSRLPINHPQLRIIQGSPLDKIILETALTGCAAVLSALNVSRKNDFPWAPLKTPPDFLSTVMKNIIELATKLSISRVIFMSAWGVAETKKELPGWFRWLIEHSNIRYPYLDHERQEELVRQSSLQWTAVRAAGLTNSKKIKEARVSFDGQTKHGWMINRATVASFMLDALEKNLYVQQSPVVSEI
jgi:putative NADH-flavin reductase